MINEEEEEDDEEELAEARKNRPKESQHGGFGRQLMSRAEAIAIEAGYTQIAVISGVGVRHYYRRLGYELRGGESWLSMQLEQRCRWSTDIQGGRTQVKANF